MKIGRFKLWLRREKILGSWFVKIFVYRRRNYYAPGQPDYKDTVGIISYSLNKNIKKLRGYDIISKCFTTYKLWFLNLTVYDKAFNKATRLSFAKNGG